MQSNAEYTRNIENENFKTRLYNQQQQDKQELDQIASRGREQQEPFEIFEGLAKFSGTLSKAIADEANRQTKRNIAEAQVADLRLEDLVAQHDARIAQTNGSITLNANIRENAARSGEDPLETITNHVANPAIVGAARQVYENRRALALYNTLMDRASLTEEGLAASNDMDLQRDLQNRIKADVLVTMGNPKAAYLAEALGTIEQGNAVRINNVKASQLKIVKAEAKEQIQVLYSSGNVEDAIKAYNQDESVFGRPNALNTLDEAIKTAPSEEQAQMLLSLDLKGNGKTYAEDRPDRVVPVLAERNKLQREAEKNEREQNKLDLRELVDNNIDAIYADFQRDPHQSMALWTENSAKLYDQPVPSIVKNIYSQALKDNKQDQANDIELMAARGLLTSGYVNTIDDRDNQRLGKELYQQQQIRKYGETYPAVETAIDDIAAELAKFSSQFAGDTDTQTEINKIYLAEWFENDLKATGNALQTIKNAKTLAGDAHRNDPNNPFAYKDTPAGRVYQKIGKVDPEQKQTAAYIARVSKNKTVGEVVNMPYVLMDQNQQEEIASRAAAGLPFEYTDNILQVADMFRLKPSEVYNAQAQANNSTSGKNVPLLEQSMFVQTMDNLPLESAKLFQSGLKNGSKAQMDRALTPLTGDPGYTRQQKRTANEFIDMALTSGAKFPELVAAQIILESAWGTAESGVNNLIGAKATEGEEGTLRETKEVINGKEVKTVAKFKNYESPQAGIDELVGRWYKDYQGYSGVNNANSLEEAAMMLQQQGYATDPKYAQKLIQIANRFR
jgi:flagellum-specific peptidoglycan hydrolase FlgJ